MQKMTVDTILVEEESTNKFHVQNTGEITCIYILQELNMRYKHENLKGFYA